MSSHILFIVFYNILLLLSDTQGHALKQHNADIIIAFGEKRTDHFLMGNVPPPCCVLRKILQNDCSHYTVQLYNIIDCRFHVSTEPEACTANLRLISQN